MNTTARPIRRVATGTFLGINGTALGLLFSQVLCGGALRSVFGFPTRAYDYFSGKRQMTGDLVGGKK
jgi:hypothetical protein